MPIYPGLQRPLQVQPRQMQVAQVGVLERWPHERHFPEGQAIDFMRRTHLAYPGKVVLHAIRPLTNVASLFTVYPDAAPMLKGLVMMGGRFMNPGPGDESAEWNILCDPQAAAVVFGTTIRFMTHWLPSPFSIHTSVGLRQDGLMW